MENSSGVIVEFDFTAFDGSTLLYETAKRFLKKLDGLKFDRAAEARYMAGADFQAAFAAYFPVVKTKKTAAKAAREFVAEYVAALNKAVPNAITTGFKNFVKGLTQRGVKVVIATRADLEAVGEAFATLVNEQVSLYHIESPTYGCVKWDVWCRACMANELKYRQTVAITGSGLGVKSALRSGLSSVAVMNEAVAYQDFSGVDEIVKELNAAAAKSVLRILRIEA